MIQALFDFGPVWPYLEYKVAQMFVTINEKLTEYLGQFCK